MTDRLMMPKQTVVGSIGRMLPKQEDGQMSDSMRDLLDEATAETTKFLVRTLPHLSEHWWEEVVVPALHPSSQAVARRKGNQYVYEIDLKPLLEVMCLRWRMLFGGDEPTWLACNVVHEMRSIRNRYAHMGCVQVPLQEQCRHLDTLWRYLELIDADEAIRRRAHEKWARCVLVAISPLVPSQAA
jgi:hypothetical protein